MPEKRTNMATASLEIGDTTWIFTFMGLDSTKGCGEVKLDAWKYNTVSDKWDTIAPVPDTDGRIAASATGFDGKIYLIGGYKVLGQCQEFTSPRVDIYDPLNNTWTQGDSVPTPVDDHVQVVWRDSLIVLISGWSQNTNVKNVQLYNPKQDSWLQASPIGGPGLFGHAGCIKGDTIIYIDGVKIAGNFTLENAAWEGVINPNNPQNIVWTNLPQHPGNKVYRGGGFTYGERAIFTGGTDNAYNINGIGYNAQPSTESGRTFGWNHKQQAYEEYASNPDSVMDVREVVKVGDNMFYVIGGMEANQQVTNKVSVFVVDSVMTSRPWLRGAEIEISTDNGTWTFSMSDGAPRNWTITDMLGRKVAETEQPTREFKQHFKEGGIYILNAFEKAYKTTSKAIFISSDSH